MTRNQKKYALALAVLCQLLIVVGLFVKASFPLWVGEEVRVKTIPVDPRSMFRGNYAELNYRFASLPSSSFSGLPPEKGETVYVALKPNAEGLFELDHASLSKPDDGVFLRGEVTNDYDPYQIEFGIEAFFAPKIDALALEKDLRRGGIAVLKVTGNGHVALEDVVPNPNAPAQEWDWR